MSVRSLFNLSHCKMEVFISRNFNSVFNFPRKFKSSFAEKTPSEKTYEEVDTMYNLLRKFKTAMISTCRSDDKRIKSRPIFIASVDHNCSICFATSMTEESIDELDSQIGISLQERDKFISLSGNAELLESEEINEIWTESWRLYFPQGKNDSDLRIIRMHPIKGEFWDYSASTVLQFLFKASRDAAKGKSTNDSESVGAHKEVDLLTDKDKASLSAID